LDVDFKGIDLFFEIEDGVSIDVCFDSEWERKLPLLFFWPLFLIDEERVLVFEGGNEIIESEVIGFELSELVDFLFELIDEEVFLFIFDLGELVGLDGSLSVVEVLAVHDNG
jgi:hypothetical protein